MLDPVTETTMKTAICTGDSWCLQVFLTRFVGDFWIEFAVSHHYSNHIFLQGSWWRLTPCHPLQATHRIRGSETDCAHPKPPKKQKTPNPQWYIHAWLDAFFFGFGPVFSQQSILGSCICPTEVLAALKLDNRVLLPPLLHHCYSTTHCLHLKTII